MSSPEYDASAPTDASPTAPGDRAPSLAVRATRSSLWSLIGQVFQVVLGLASFAVLSRWLTPNDYGLLGMAATVSGFLGVVGDSGITAAVTRLPAIDATAEATGFWLSLAGGSILTLLAVVAAPILALFFKDHAIMLVALALAAGFILAAPMRVSNAKLSRALQFRELTIIAMVSNTAAVTVAAVLAWRGLGVWALVAQTTTVFVLQSVLTLAACPVHISPRLWSRARARELTHAGSRLSGFSLAMTIGRALDTILTGRYVGSSALGLMSMSLKLVYQPVERLCGAVYSVFLPTTVEIDDRARQSRAFRSAMRLLFIIVSPFCLGVVAVAPEIVVLLPAKWAALTPVLRFYAATSLALPIGYLSMSVLVANGRAGALFRMAVALIPISWAAAILGAFTHSVLGMVAAWAFSIVAGALILLGLLRSTFTLGRPFLWAVVVPLAVSALMAAGVRGSLSLVGLGGRRAGLFVGGALGMVLYAMLAWLTMRADVARAAGLVRDALSRRRGRR